MKIHPFFLLFAALAAMFGVQTLELSGPLRSLVIAPIGLFVVAATLWVLHERRAVFWTAAVMAIPALINTIFTPGPLEAAEITESGFHWPFFCFAAVAVTMQVVRSERASGAAVVGSICAYLMISFAFASLYVNLEMTWPGSFGFREPPPAYLLFSKLSYFSYVTLTTLGYGDIAPLSDLARAFVTLESVVGILFPSVVIARIVSLAVSGGGRPFALPVSGLRRPGRFELLIGLEIAIMLLGPLENSPATRGALRLLTTALLLAALYAGSNHPPTRAIGIALGSFSVVGRWWPEAGPVWVPAAAMVSQTIFLALVSGSLLRWLIGEKRVTRDLLLAAFALFMLLGYVWSSLYNLMELQAPGSIGGPEGHPVTQTDLLYYSFMTLTTTGFGDFAPISRAAQQVATLEALVGILFPTVLVARLVALYQTD